MSDGQILGLAALLCLSFLVLGFIVGWCANPSDDHDPRDEGDLL